MQTSLHWMFDEEDIDMWRFLVFLVRLPVSAIWLYLISSLAIIMICIFFYIDIFLVCLTPIVVVAAIFSNEKSWPENWLTEFLPAAVKFPFRMTKELFSKWWPFFAAEDAKA